MTGLLAGLEHDPAEVRDRAAELLSRPPFHEDEGRLAQLWASLREWVAEMLGRLLGAVAGDAAIAWVVVGIGVVLAVLLVWRLTRGLSLDRSVAQEPLATGGGWSSSRWVAYAADRTERGDHDEAVRAHYLGLVTRLVERGLIEDVPGRTVGELDRELSATAPTLAPPVARAGSLFAEVFYGRRPATSADVQRLAELVTEVEGGGRTFAGTAGHGRVGGAG